MALWLEAHNPGEPLNFLDHRIKVGNAVAGLARFEELDADVPDAAFNRLEGDHGPTAARLKTLNKEFAGRETLFATNQQALLDAFRKKLDAWNALPEGAPDEVAEKARRYKKLLADPALAKLKAAADARKTGKGTGGLLEDAGSLFSGGGGG